MFDGGGAVSSLVTITGSIATDSFSGTGFRLFALLVDASFCMGEAASELLAASFC